MKITKQELIDLDACVSGLKRFIKQTNGTEDAVEVASLVGGENTYGDLLWLAIKRLPEERIVRFACDCALINIEKIKPYTNKYDMIVGFLNNPAGDAGDAVAAVAAVAASCAGHATDAAGYAAGYAAVYAADAVDCVVGCAAGYTINAARAAGNCEEVNKLLQELFA